MGDLNSREGTSNLDRSILSALLSYSNTILQMGMNWDKYCMQHAAVVMRWSCTKGRRDFGTLERHSAVLWKGTGYFFEGTRDVRKVHRRSSRAQPSTSRTN